MNKKQFNRDFRIDLQNGFYVVKRIYNVPQYKERILSKFVTKNAAINYLNLQFR